MATPHDAKLLDVISGAIESTVDIDKLYGQLQQLGQPDQLQGTLVEVSWLLWVRLEGAANSGKRLRLVEILRAFIKDKRIDRRQAMEMFEHDCMQAVGLLGDNQAAERWKRQEVRFNTKTAYTQNKYNLLREDSEGYAKLITCLNSCGEGALNEEAVELMFQEVQALIGYFDLDPNRVLDLVLEAAVQQPDSSGLVKLVTRLKPEAVVQLLGFKFQQHQKPDAPPAPPDLYLLAARLLSAGLVTLEGLLPHLAPSDQEIGRTQKEAAELLKSKLDDIGSVSLTTNAINQQQQPQDEPRERTWQEERRAAAAAAAAAAPGAMGAAAAGHWGNSGAAPMLVGGAMGPPGLMAMAGGGGMAGGAPPMAGRPGMTAAMMELDVASFAPLLLAAGAERNQRLGLVLALVQLRCWAPAWALIDRLAARGLHAVAWPPLTQALLAAVSTQVDPLYKLLVPRGGAAPCALDTGEPLPALPPLPGDALALLQRLGAFVYSDVQLLFKLVRLLRCHLQLHCGVGREGDAAPAPAPAAVAAAGGEDGASAAAGEGAPFTAATEAEAAALKAAERVISGCVLPASMLVPANAALSSELWCLLSLLPYRTRFRLYGEAREATAAIPTTLVPPPSAAAAAGSGPGPGPAAAALLVAASRLAAWETRRVLKRLARPERDEGGRERRETKEAMRPYARMLAKAAHATPLAVMDVLIQMVESYTNQIEQIVDALKFMSPLSFDVLTYTVLYRLSVERDKVKEDGFTIADWLQNLSTFNAAVCHKYSGMEISAICQLLANQLRAGDSFDLLVLKELVESMTGITIIQEVSDKQLDALSGGPELRDRAIVKTSEERERSSRAWSRSSRRLLGALQRGAPHQHLALPLLILVAQQRHIVTAAAAEGQHIKLIADMYDKCQEAARQYVCFLQKALLEEDYARLLPPLDVQRLQYNLDPEIVYCAYRPTLKRLLFLTAPLPEDGELEEGEEAPPASGAPAPTTAPEPEVAGLTWSRVLSSMRASVTDPGLWEVLNPELYATFWTLDITDVYVPTRRYQEEIVAVEAELSSLERTISQARAASTYASQSSMYGAGGPASGVAVSGEELERLKKARTTLQDTLSKLKSEVDSQNKHFKEVNARMERDKGGLFTKTARRNNFSLLQECLLPRLLFSPEDALFCAKFFEMLHELDTPNFATLMVYNEVIKCCFTMLKCITVREGANMGIFLKEVLQLLMHWRSTEKVYSEECQPKLGFLISMNTADGRKTTYDQFCKLMFKWHRDIYGIMATCLHNEEWTSRRNALAVLTAIVEHYPVVSDHFRMVARNVEEVRDKEQREDLKKLAQGYLNLLDREKAKPNRNLPATSWGGTEKKAPPRAGAGKPTPPPAAASPAKAAAAKEGGARQANSNTGLRPEARPFQPTASKGGAVAAASPGPASTADGREAKEEAGRGGSGGGNAVKREAPANDGGSHKRARHAEEATGGGGGGAAANGAAGGEREGRERGERDGRDKERGERDKEGGRDSREGREGKEGKEAGEKERGERSDKRIKVERRGEAGAGDDGKEGRDKDKDKEDKRERDRSAAATSRLGGDKGGAAERKDRDGREGAGGGNDGDAGEGHAHDGGRERERGGAGERDRERGGGGERDRDARSESRGRDKEREAGGGADKGEVAGAGVKADRKRLSAAEPAAAEASPSRRERRDAVPSRDAEGHEGPGVKRRRADVGAADLRQALRNKHGESGAAEGAAAATGPPAAERTGRGARRDAGEEGGVGGGGATGRGARGGHGGEGGDAPASEPAPKGRRSHK